MDNVLIVAFDGLDYDQIREFDLEAVRQHEFGRINNHTSITAIKTSELFASFITGTTHEEHGVTGLSLLEHPWVDSVEQVIQRIPLLRRNKRFRTAFYESVLGVRKRRYTRQDVQAATWFEQVADSRALFVPAYNPSPVWEHRQLLNYPLHQLETEIEKEFHWRKKQLWEAFEAEHRLLMCHFHYPDFLQHLYPALGQEERLEAVYQEIDTLAADIRERAQERYDTIIFMSDHGLPEKHEHNRNAFYSCNHALFDGVPHITDFHGAVLDRVQTA